MRWSLAILCLFALISGVARGEDLPERLVPAELARASAAREEVGGPYPGWILTPELVRPATDGKYNQPYNAGCFVYIPERSGGSVVGYARRFVVYAPDKDSLPTAKRVARLLLLLYGLNRERMKFDHFRNAPTVEVWLTRNAGAGLDTNVAGEQFKNQIYIYNLYAERRPVEWMREVAHEYGHYALPYISGFTAPEDWGNGVLGERLFVKWIADGLHDGRLKPESVPFASPEEIESYVSKQVTPLIRRFARDGVEARTLAKRDAGGMDTFTGFALYIDAVYGSEPLRMAFAYMSSSQGNTFITSSDFLRGAEASLRSASEITVTPPLAEKDARSATFFFYMPRGDFTVSLEGAARGWQFAPETKGITPQGKTGVICSVAAWRKITLSLTNSPMGVGPGKLTLRRRGAEVP
jgi:hypothetical protein